MNSGLRRFEESGADFIFISVVEKDGHEIESDYPAEFPGEDAESLLGSMGERDGLGDAERGFERAGRDCSESGLLSCGHAFVYLDSFQEGQPVPGGNFYFSQRAAIDSKFPGAVRGASSASSARGQTFIDAGGGRVDSGLGIGGDSSGSG